ncbi:MAG: hypothetical protein A2749_01000 [Parcubacteria group bacterium RIFCSPHIGHO2_01_FULL_45_26]|nr:MAG: hypothetical protein A2749_01000 [Parcubacteria group bacterium RIFCSPHIGHO2_01_FULL_45_26]
MTAGESASPTVNLVTHGMSESERVALITLTLEIIAENHGWKTTRGLEVHRDGAISLNAMGYTEKLMRWGAENMPLRRMSDKLNMQLALKAAGFATHGFKADGDWGQISLLILANAWVMGRMLAGEAPTHQHAEASSATCSHPECLVRNLSFSSRRDEQEGTTRPVRHMSAGDGGVDGENDTCR